MLTRFLIVVLAILNVGVALWWLTPRAAAPVLAEPAETGVATLELVQAAVPTAATAVPDTAAATAPVAAPAVEEAVAPPSATVIRVWTSHTRKALSRGRASCCRNCKRLAASMLMPCRSTS